MHKPKYVYYNGRYWLYEGLQDHIGHISLIDIKDHSKGINAPKEKVYPASKEQCEAIEYFLTNKF